MVYFLTANNIFHKYIIVYVYYYYRRERIFFYRSNFCRNSETVRTLNILSTLYILFLANGDYTYNYNIILICDKVTKMRQVYMEIPGRSLHAHVYILLYIYWSHLYIIIIIMFNDAICIWNVLWMSTTRVVVISFCLRFQVPEGIVYYIIYDGGFQSYTGL